MEKKNNSFGVRELGILMLGAGVLLFALIALHFYVTQVLPHTGNRGGFDAYCQSWDKSTVVITVNNYGSESITDANVYVNEKLACQLSDIPPGSSDICKAEVEGNAPVFRVVAITSGGRKLKDAGVCPMYEVVHPVVD